MDLLGILLLALALYLGVTIVVTLLLIGIVVLDKRRSGS
jgi:hypothetical protein